MPDWRSDAPDRGRAHLLSSVSFARQRAAVLGGSADAIVLARWWSRGGAAAAGPSGGCLPGRWIQQAAALASGYSTVSSDSAGSLGISQRISSVGSQESTRGPGRADCRIRRAAALSRLSVSATESARTVRLGRHHRAVTAFEQDCVQRALDLLYLPADRTVGEMQIIGRLADTAMPDGGLEGGERAEGWQVGPPHV